MIREYVRRDISDFIDGELPSSEQDKLFSDPSTARENREYLDIIRLIKRGSGELFESAPEGLRASVAAVSSHTVRVKRNSGIFTVMWVTLSVLLVAAVIWALTITLGGKKPPVPLPVSSAATVSSQSSSELPPSSEETSSLAESKPDYSFWLPDNVDFNLPQEYRNMKFAYVITCRGRMLSDLTVHAGYTAVYKGDGDSPVALVVTENIKQEDAVKLLKQSVFISIGVNVDEGYDGIDSTSEYGLIFVRYLDV